MGDEESEEIIVKRMRNMKKNIERIEMWLVKGERNIIDREKRKKKWMDYEDKIIRSESKEMRRENEDDLIEVDKKVGIESKKRVFRKIRKEDGIKKGKKMRIIEERDNEIEVNGKEEMIGKDIRM